MSVDKLNPPLTVIETRGNLKKCKFSAVDPQLTEIKLSIIEIVYIKIVGCLEYFNDDLIVYVTIYMYHNNNNNANIEIGYCKYFFHCLRSTIH